MFCIRAPSGRGGARFVFIARVYCTGLLHARADGGEVIEAIGIVGDEFPLMRRPGGGLPRRVEPEEEV